MRAFERKQAKVLDIRGKSDVFERDAVLEGLPSKEIPESHHTVGNLDGKQRSAVLKDTGQVGNTIGNIDLFQASAVTESIIAKRRYAIGKDYLLYRCALKVFVNRFISIICTLNGRKVIT